MSFESFVIRRVVDRLMERYNPMTVIEMPLEDGGRVVLAAAHRSVSTRAFLGEAE
jgi:hypothetical protein